MVCEYEFIDGIIKVNCLDCVFCSSIEDSDVCMATAIDKIMKVKDVERLILTKTREYEYDYDQTKLLIEIANLYDKLLNEDRLLESSFVRELSKFIPDISRELEIILKEMLRRDPIAAYVQIKRFIRKYNTRAAKSSGNLKKSYNDYIRLLTEINNRLEKTKLIQLVKDKIYGYKLGDRSFYRKIFKPLIRPIFMLTRYVSIPPKGSKMIDRYKLPGDTLVEIFKVPEKARPFYFITPPEFNLPEDKYSIIDSARKYLAEHKPAETEFIQPEKAREIFMNMGEDTISKLANEKGLYLSSIELKEMANILARYTAGFGILEVLLSDHKLQDIYINSPIGLTPVFVGHSDFEECETNLIPTKEDAESWATRFRMLSGRPLDEANPVLDTELLVPGGRARVAAITKTLSPGGIGYSLRRHRDRPWTYPLFLDAKFFDPLFAGLMSFLVQGSRSLLFAGGRSSGKSSLLGATMLEIMRKFRIVTVEDSVLGDCEIAFYENKRFQKEKIGKKIDNLFSEYGFEVKNNREILGINPTDIRVFSLNNKGKIELSNVSKFIRHKVKKDIFKITTRTGKTIEVTGDHSLFSMNDNGDVVPFEARKLKKGNYIVTPKVLPLENENINEINLLQHLDKLPKTYVCGEYIRNLFEKYKKYIEEISFRYHKSTIKWWRREKIMPSGIFLELSKKYPEIKNLSEFYLKHGHSKKIPSKIALDEDFLSFIGLWLADGCYAKRSVLLSVVDEDSRSVVKNIAKRFGLNVTRHSDNFTLLLNSSILKTVLKNIFNLKGSSFTKKVPNWIFSLSKEQISYFLKGLFSGDGYLSKYEVAINLSSKKMIKDIETLLLMFGVITRTHKIRKDSTYSCQVSSLNNIRSFSKNIGFLQKDRMEKLKKISARKSTHDTTDIIPFSLEFKKKLNKVVEKFNSHDYIKRENNIGRNRLGEIIKKIDQDHPDIKEKLEILESSDIYWDEIEKVTHKKKELYVYDISVPGNENFVCENILAHNTLELPITQLRNLGYNIERMKSRSVITRIESELPADEALRTALRLGDSCLIIGEVRSKEAQALWEAMRIGALANVVAGTIHGESAYGVFDRVVNDLGVPTTSFKATDVIAISGMIRSADGLHRNRRVVEVTEIRKHWKNDPMEENGFVNLMEYSAKEDKLKPTDTLINGESYIINEIAKRVKEWHSNWDAVWSNIVLRGDIKQKILDYAIKLNRKDILEAEWVAKSNDMFHMISDDVKKEVGSLDSKEIFKRWNVWLKNELKGA